MTSPYRNIVSLRSRRLRLIGSLFLLATVLMSVYGGFVLMPSLYAARHNIATLEQKAVQSQPRPSAVTSKVRPAPSNPTSTPEWRAYRQGKKGLLTYVIFLYGYWAVCSLCLIAAVVIAWLDMREIARSYALERRDMWNEMANRSGGRRE